MAARNPKRNFWSVKNVTLEQRDDFIADLERKKMREAARNFDFEKPAQFRDKIRVWKTPKAYEQTAASCVGRDG